MSEHQAPNLMRISIIAIALGLGSTFISIVIGKQSPYPSCTSVNSRLNMVDRGFPLSYFRVTPSDSDCKPVEGVAAVFKSDVGNAIKPVSLIADIAIWSLLASTLIYLPNRASERIAS